jgi:hypothetical protein
VKYPFLPPLTEMEISKLPPKAKGIDNVYEIAFAPSDKKRKNVYDHYIQSLFPDWKKDLTKTSNSWVYLINKNYKGK